MLPEMQYEPVQTPLNMAPFLAGAKDSVFTVTPLFEYDLYGMVVTYHRSTDLSDTAHARWGDKLNIEDICVLWGSNLLGNMYKNIEFTSGNWTCFFRTKDQNTWETFNQSAISNSHLLAENKQLIKAIRGTHRGDQIHIKGYLVNYTNVKGFYRNTSTTRQDVGQGACEIVYVTDYKILKRGSPLFYPLFTLSKYLIALSAALLIAIFILETKSSREIS